MSPGFLLMTIQNKKKLLATNINKKCSLGDNSKYKEFYWQKLQLFKLFYRRQ